MAEVKSGSGGTYWTGKNNRYFYSLLVYDTSTTNTTYTVSATSKVAITGNHGVNSSWSGTLSATGQANVSGTGSLVYKKTACTNRTEGRDIKTLKSTSYSWTRTCANQIVTINSTVKCTGGSGIKGWYSKSVTASQNFTISARPQYTITYDANGGTLAPNTVCSCNSCKGNHKSYDYDCTLSSATPTRSGYTFLRWNTQPDGSGTNYAKGATYTTNANLQLYAIWQPNPTCSYTPNQGPYYTGQEDCYSVNINNIVIGGGASVSNITLNFGNQTDSINSEGTLAITPEIAGTFTPTITITDSFGASTTYPMNPVVVKQYIPPSIAFNVERTDTTGRSNEADGTACVITAVFVSTCLDVYRFMVPTVTYIDTTHPVTITWYNSRAATGEVSEPITNWNNITSNQVVYGLITNVLNPAELYTIFVTPKDDRSDGLTKTQTLPMAVFPLDVYAGGKGIAFGRIATSNGLFCQMPATFENDMILSLDNYAGDETIDYQILDALNNLNWTNDVLTT